jgi:phage baseplate assembly protein W
MSEAFRAGKEFLGAGWSFPLGINERGGISLSTGETDIQEAIRMILLTAKGERVMRPEFGSDIYKLIFAPNNATTHGLMRFYVLEALERWEPRIEEIEVDVRPHSQDEAQMLVSVRYQLRGSNHERNLVFPFYLIPGED